jgi:hypothetical protein
MQKNDTASGEDAGQSRLGRFFRHPIVVGVISAVIGYFFHDVLHQNEARSRAELAAWHTGATAIQRDVYSGIGLLLYASDRILRTQDANQTASEYKDALRAFNQVDDTWGRSQDSLVARLDQFYPAPEVDLSWNQLIDRIKNADAAIDSLDAYWPQTHSPKHSAFLNQAHNAIAGVTVSRDSLMATLSRFVTEVLTQRRRTPRSIIAGPQP